MTLARARLEAGLLLGLAVALAGYLWFTRHQLGTVDREGRQAHVLPTFDASAVRRIVISDAASGDPVIVLRRDPKSSDLHEYRLGDPSTKNEISPEVDRAELASLLRTLDFATFLRTMEATDLPAEAFGETGLTLDVEMDAVNYRLIVGGPAPSPAGSRYAHTTGDDGTDRAGVVPDSLASALHKDARQLRGRLLFPHARSQTKSLVIERSTHDGPPIRTVLAADALGFRVTQTAVDEAASPGRALPAMQALRADPARVEGLFFQLARAGMDAYPKTTATPAAPTIVVEQTPETGPTVRLEIGGECPNHPDLVQVLRTAPDSLTGCTNRTLLDALSPRDLALHGAWPFAADEIDHIVVTSEANTLDLIRDGAGFRRLAPEPAPLSLEQGNDYLTELSEQLLTLTPCRGTKSGQVRVVAQPEGSSGGREFRLTLLRHAEESLLRREDDGACLLLTERAEWLLDPEAAWYESLEILNVHASDVLVLETSGPDLAREVVRREGEELRLEGSSVDEGLLDATLHALSPLRALRVAPGTGTTQWNARLDLRIEARSTGPFDLRIGPRVRGGYLAQLAGRRTEFVLSPEVVRTLETSLVSRRRAQWDPTAFSELTVTARGLGYRFRRVGSDLLPIDDSPRELGPALTEALSRLTPIAAVRHDKRPPRPSNTPEELRLEGIYEAEDGKVRRITVSFGAQVLHADQLAQQMTIDGTGPQYYVDRAAVLAVLDLL